MYTREDGSIVEDPGFWPDCRFVPYVEDEEGAEDADD